MGSPWCVVLVLAVGCGNKKDDNAATTGTPAGPAKAAMPAGFVDVNNLDGLIIKVPPDAKVKDNSLGVGWFENADKSFAITIKPVGEDATDIEALKTVIKDQVKDWLKQEKTADGFILTYSAPKIEMVDDGAGGFARKEVGLEYGLQMRRIIAGHPFKCAAGTITTPGGLEAVIAACNSIRAK